MAIPGSLMPPLVAVQVQDASLNSLGLDPRMGNGYVYDTFLGSLYTVGQFVGFRKREEQMSVSISTVTCALVDEDDILYIETPLP